MAPESTIKAVGQLCSRPDSFDFASLAVLYLLFESLFLADGGVLESLCGHTVLIFDHHFFHLVALRGDFERLSMAKEKEEIRQTVEGFGRYTLDHGGSRARNLPSAKATIEDPDEVWEGNPRVTGAKWVYVKEFDSRPYPYTVALLTIRPEEGHVIVPVSSFPCKRTDARKWRQGRLVYQNRYSHLSVADLVTLWGFHPQSSMAHMMHPART